MKSVDQDRQSLFLLLSLLAYFVMVSFLQNFRIGRMVLLVLFFTTLVSAAVALSQRRAVLWAAAPLIASSILVEVLSHLYPRTRPLVIADNVLSVAFFGLVTAALFAYLGHPGAITSGRLYASVSLYLILAMFWFSVYNLIETLVPGSFLQMAPTQANVHRDTLLYFSLVALTTVGFGDVVPVSPPARGFAALEAASGVLYIAITVARLVAAYQVRTDKDA